MTRIRLVPGWLPVRLPARPAVGIVPVALSLLLSACGGGGEESAAPAIQPADPELASCTLCGMVVREQPIPRAQIVHRDGTRVHLCAASELGTYLAAPSPHGKPAAVYVEVFGPDDDAATAATDPRPWLFAENAHYVVGGPERPVMGQSVLAYRSAEEARRVAAACGGTALDWAGLLAHLGN